MCKCLSDTLPIQSGLQRVNTETLLPSSFALEFTNKEGQANQKGLKLDGMLWSVLMLIYSVKTQ
jgi:hypothetical protein